MTASHHVIDDTEMIQPHIRLCHRILADALATGYGIVELASPQGEMPIVRAQVEGNWKPLMAFPPAVFGPIIEYLKAMAGVPNEQQEENGTILVRLAGTDASIKLRARRNSQGSEEVILNFPVTPVARAAV